MSRYIFKTINQLASPYELIEGTLLKKHPANRIFD